MIAAGTASGMVGSALKKSCTAEGRISAASTKFDNIDKRHQDFLIKALPRLTQTHPQESICTNSKKTTRALNRYEPPNPCVQIPHEYYSFQTRNAKEYVGWYCGEQTILGTPFAIF